MLKEFKTLVPYLKKYRLQYLAGFLFLVLTDAGQLVIPQIVSRAINSVSGGGILLKDILALCGLMLAIAVLIGIGRFGWRYFIHGTSRRIETELREKLFTHILTLPASFFGKNRTGDLMARATNDMGAIRQATGMALVAFIDGVFMSLTILTIMIINRPGLALMTIIPLPFLTFMVIGFGKLIGKLFKNVQEGFSRLSTHVQEAVSGIRVIKSFVQEHHSSGRFAEANEDYKKKNMELVRVWGFFFPVAGFLSGLTSLILLWMGGQAVLLGTLSPGEFVATLSYLQMLIWPMMGAGFTVNMLQRGAASMGRINEVLSEVPEIRSRPGAVVRPPEGHIEVRNLTYSYPDAQSTALENVSFTIPKGKTLGILGRTGSGKSTLIRMLPRLIDPPPGTVFLDGNDVRDYDVTVLRRAFGFVPQDTFLFSDTVRRNIAFGNPEAAEELIGTVADISTISRDLATFPAGLDTEVGERGVTLSGGQKQRIAISRALAVNPEILVFDDALSAVDTETEEKILSAIRRVRGNRTGILISHRVSTLQSADLIIVLDGGRIIQSGSHEELVRSDGLYAEIHALQQPVRT